MDYGTDDQGASDQCSSALVLLDVELEETL